MLLITAPSKTQSPISNQESSTRPLFLEEASQLIGYLNNFSLEELCQLMNMSEKLGITTMQRIKDFKLPITNANCKQALFTFQGDNYEYLRPEEYSTSQLDHAQNHLIILSGLYGILRPLDLMYPYRLEMGTKLSTNKGKNLYEFWGSAITEAINETCRTQKFDVVVNLASAEYSKSIRKNELETRFLTLTFKEKKESGFKTIPIHSKRARGMMMDFMISNQLTKADQLKSFDNGGYFFNEELSDDNEWIFTRIN